ncbi:Transcriptional regulator [gamma proteobacterium HdN1]|nr:Transcriptional regulator [gamma proteobacterium HdN1]
MIDEPAAAKPRRRNTRERIIDEAEALASLHGIEHLKLQDIADRIGIKLPSVYAHFRGREDILDAVGERIAAALATLYDAKAGESARATLMRSAHELTQFLAENPAYYRLMLRDLSVPMGYDSVNRRISPHRVAPLSAHLTQVLGKVELLLKKLAQEENAQPVPAVAFVSAIYGASLVRLSISTDEGNAPAAEVLIRSLQTLVARLAGISE